MIIIGSISYKGLVSLTKTAHWVSHTHKAIGETHLIEKNLVSMETGVRGYLITGNEKFLKPYKDAKVLYDTTFKALRDQVKDNLLQQTKLDRINSLVIKWHNTSATPAIELRGKVIKGGIDASFLQDTLAKGTGKAILDEIRQIMSVMIEDFRLDGNVKAQALTEAIGKSMLDQETGERGYLITGKDEFLEPLRAGKKKLAINIANLRKLLDNAHDRIGTVTSLGDLKKLAAKWLREAGEFEIDLRRQVNKGLKTQKELEKVLAKGHGKTILDEMRQIMDSMTLMFSKAENDEAKILVLLIAKSMVDQETGQRGFIITGKDEFLEPYINGQEAFKKAILALQKLNSNAYDITQMKGNIRKLENLAAQWLKKAANPEIAAR